MDSRRCERLCDSKLNCCPGSFFLRGNLDAWVLPGVLSDVSSSFFPHHLTCDSHTHPLPHLGEFSGSSTSVSLMLPVVVAHGAPVRFPTR
jgi:hypothetical protein